jgi:hypothetical protein
MYSSKHNKNFNDNSIKNISTNKSVIPKQIDKPVVLSNQIDKSVMKKKIDKPVVLSKQIDKPIIEKKIDKPVVLSKQIDKPVIEKKIDKPVVLSKKIDKSVMEKQININENTFNPKEFIRNNSIRNSYDICIIKKFIGKKILIPAKGIVITPKIKLDAKNIKAQLLSSDNCKNLIMHVVCINGIMHIINGFHYYLALNSIAYKDIETNQQLKNIDIKIVQLPKVSNIELQKLIEYFI